MTSRTTLGQALPIKYGKARTAQFGYVAEEVPVYGSSGVIGSFDRALTTGPSLIIGRKGSAGSVHYASDPCWPIDTVYYAEAQGESFLPYFRYLLEHLRLGQHDKSTAIPSLSRDDYNSIAIWVPSLAAQRAAVLRLDERLSRLDASVAALHRAQANLKRYRASVLKAACEGRLFDAAVPRPSGLPGNWESESLGALLDGTPQNGIYVPKMRYGAGVSIVRITDYQNDWTRPSCERLKVSLDSASAAPYRLRTGDLLINRVNSLSHLGKVMMACEADEESIFESNMMRVRLGSRALPSYVALYLRSHAGRAALIKRAKWAVNQASINQGDIRACVVPLPPLAEQHRIVAEADRRLSLVRSTEAQIAASLARAKRLRQSILQAAFSPPEVDAVDARGSAAAG